MKLRLFNLNKNQYNLNSRKMNLQVQKQGMKIACVAFAIFSMASVANAQTKTGDIAKKTSGSLNGTVRVVDNKGTIKYLQTANGLTTLTNTTTDATTTTWQLGGTLTNDTYIDATGKVFVLDGLTLTAVAAAKIGKDASVHGTTGAGYTLLVHNEATGATEKLLVSNLIVGGHDVFSVSDATTVVYQATGGAAGNYPILDYKVSVYRNGAKLVPTNDYSFDADGKLTLKPASTADQDWALNVGDKIEVNWIL
jgi:hypothetical protein